jgi:coenzyme F420 biosynthesis associated uncharacterized protein
VSTDPAIDWAAAAEFAAFAAAPGPQATRAELADLVEGLRQAASEAVPHVVEATGMTPADGRAATPEGLADVRVIDRATWAAANVQVMESLLSTVPETPRMPGSASLGGALQVGGVLALLSSRVLGQFDPYGTDGPGRLLLVAPNVLAAEQGMGVDPHDFRLWVCLHELTHAMQFAMAPWLVAHMKSRIGGLIEDMMRTATELGEAPWYTKLAMSGRTLAGLVTAPFREGGAAPFERLLTRDQQDQLASLTAIMALLEGHADVMMDAVGPSVVPSVEQIRAKFERRRDGASAPRLDVILRKLLGMEAKLAQYRDGAAFVRAVMSEVGRDGLNRVWTSPDTLPTAREIADPVAWMRRVSG